MSNGSGSNAENVRFMSIRCPKTSALCKQSNGHSETESSTYVVILNQDTENQATSGNLSHASAKLSQGARDAIEIGKSKSKSRVIFSTNDDLKLNLTNEFDSYDSSSSSQKVFQDGIEEAKDKGLGEAAKIIRLKIPPSSLQKAMQISRRLNAQRHLSGTPATQLNMLKEHHLSGTPATQVQGDASDRSSSLMESGYSSANSSCFSKESFQFETPSTVPLPARHETAREIFHKSSAESLTGKLSDTDPSLLTPSPTSPLSLGLRNVAVHQSSFSSSPISAQTSQNSQRTSTPRSGYVVESANGQRFILPVDPQQTKAVSVSKSDSYINIKPLDMAHFLQGSSSNNKALHGRSTDNSDTETQSYPKKNAQTYETSGDLSFVDGDKANVKCVSKISPEAPLTSEEIESTSASVFLQERVGNVVLNYALKENDNVIKVEVEDKTFPEEIPDSQESTEKGIKWFIIIIL